MTSMHWNSGPIIILREIMTSRKQRSKTKVGYHPPYQASPPTAGHIGLILRCVFVQPATERTPPKIFYHLPHQRPSRSVPAAATTARSNREPRHGAQRYQRRPLLPSLSRNDGLKIKLVIICRAKRSRQWQDVADLGPAAFSDPQIPG